MIPLFKINKYVLDMHKYSHMLNHRETELEERFAEYVGAKYACAANSATNLLWLVLKRYALEGTKITIPSMIPIVVPNTVLNADCKIKWDDNIDWVGGEYKILPVITDSAQKVEPNQYKNGFIVYSFYPTKPIGGMDGGMIVSDNKTEIDWFRCMVHNGASAEVSSWDKKLSLVGQKMYMNSAQIEIVIRNFEKYPEKLERLSEVREKYNKAFGLSHTSNHLYRIEVDEREQFIYEMEKLGIACGIHYKPAHRNSLYYSGSETLPKTERVGLRTVSIPFNEGLTKEQVRYIIRKVCVYVHGNELAG